MPVQNYEYQIEQCDVAPAQRKSLKTYREFRQSCLDDLFGDSDASIANQLHALAWHSAVFKTLNEARRLEPDRAVNGALWELAACGYAVLMTVGIRKLMDDDKKSNSVLSLLIYVERHSTLVTRENFVCFDGLPYDYEAVQQTAWQLSDWKNPGFNLSSTKGPQAWGTSEMMHKAFDALSGIDKKEDRTRTDEVQIELFNRLKRSLLDTNIESVKKLVNKVIVHADRRAMGKEAFAGVTYNQIDEAFEKIVRVASFVSTLFASGFGNVLATPQFDVLENLNSSWASKPTIPLLQDYWDTLSTSMDSWTSGTLPE